MCLCNPERFREHGPPRPREAAPVHPLLTGVRFDFCFTQQIRRFSLKRPSSQPATSYRRHRAAVESWQTCHAARGSHPGLTSQGCCQPDSSGLFPFKWISLWKATPESNKVSSQHHSLPKNALCLELLIPDFSLRASPRVGLNIYATQRGLADLPAGGGLFTQNQVEESPQC